jgi:AcrR family transcriptional regulator
MSVAVAARPSQLSARQEEILDALEDTFLRDGLEVTVGELALRARCSRRTLYEIAQSKGQLFVLVVDRMLQRIGLQARETIALEATHADALRAFMAAAQPQLQRVTPRFARALELHRPARRVYERHAALARTRLAQIVAAGVEAGEFAAHDPSVVADVLVAVPQAHAVEFLMDGLRAR